jgi:hypothetical protein
MSRVNRMRCGREHLSAHSRAPHLFNLIFGPTIALVIDHLNDFFFTCEDALGILLIIRIVCQHNIQLQVSCAHTSAQQAAR